MKYESFEKLISNDNFLLDIAELNTTDSVKKELIILKSEEILNELQKTLSDDKNVFDYNFYQYLDQVKQFYKENYKNYTDSLHFLVPEQKDILNSIFKDENHVAHTIVNHLFNKHSFLDPKDTIIENIEKLLKSKEFKKIVNKNNKFEDKEHELYQLFNYIASAVLPNISYEIASRFYLFIVSGQFDKHIDEIIELKKQSKNFTDDLVQFMKLKESPLKIEKIQKDNIHDKFNTGLVTCINSQYPETFITQTNRGAPAGFVDTVFEDTKTNSIHVALTTSKVLFRQSQEYFDNKSKFILAIKNYCAIKNKDVVFYDFQDSFNNKDVLLNTIMNISTNSISYNDDDNVVIFCIGDNKYNHYKTIDTYKNVSTLIDNLLSDNAPAFDDTMNVITKNLNYINKNINKDMKLLIDENYLDDFCDSLDDLAELFKHNISQDNTQVILFDIMNKIESYSQENALKINELDDLKKERNLLIIKTHDIANYLSDSSNNKLQVFKKNSVKDLEIFFEAFNTLEKTVNKNATKFRNRFLRHQSIIESTTGEPLAISFDDNSKKKKYFSAKQDFCLDKPNELYIHFEATLAALSQKKMFENFSNFYGADSLKDYVILNEKSDTNNNKTFEHHISYTYLSTAIDKTIKAVEDIIVDYKNNSLNHNLQMILRNIDKDNSKFDTELENLFKNKIFDKILTNLHKIRKDFVSNIQPELQNYQTEMETDISKLTDIDKKLENKNKSRLFRNKSK